MSSRSPRLRRTGLTAAILTTLALTLSACGGDASAEDPAPTTAAESGPHTGGRLTFAIANDPISINPHGGGSGNDSFYVSRQVVDSLVDQDPATGEIVPWLATDWTISDDATEFTFTLRDDVTFSDGTPFDATSVKATLDDIVDNGAVASSAASFVGAYAGTEVVDPTTVVVSFDKPNAPFLQALTSPALGPVAAASLELTWEERATAGVVGTGPFVLDHYTPDTEVLLTKRAGYAWPSEVSENPGEAYLDEVLFQVVPEASVRTGSLASGQVDAIGSVPPQDQDRLTSGGFGLVVRANPGTTFGLTPYTEKPFLDEVAVRRAFTLALDREQIRDAAVSPDYDVSTSVLSDTTPGWTDLSARLAHDPDEANRLLDEAGFVRGADGIRERDGQRLHLVIGWQTNFVANQTAVELIQAQVAEVGIEVELLSGTVPEITEGESSGTYDFRHGNSSRADGDVLRTSFSSQSKRPFTAGDAELDALLAQQQAIVDPAERNAVLAKAQERILDEALHIPTFQLTTVLGVAPGTQGVWLGADSRLGSLSSASVTP